MRGQAATFDNFSAATLAFQFTTLPFTDHFTNGNGSDLSPFWTEKAGAFTIQSNTAVATNAVPNFSLATLNTAPVADTITSADVTVTTAGAHAGLIARYSGAGEFASNFYVALIYNNPASGKYEAYLFVKLSGQAYQQLGATKELTNIPAGTGNLRFEVVGNQLKLFVNNKLQMVAYDSTITAAGAVGIRAAKSSIDEFNAAAIPTQIAVLPYTDHFTNPVNGSDLDRVWTEKAGAFTIEGNTAKATNVVPNFSLATLNTAAVADTIVSADATIPSGGHAGLIARYTGSGEFASNFYVALVYNNPTSGKYEAYLFVKQNGQAYQQLGPTKDLTGVFSGAGTDTLRFEVLGNQLKFYVHGLLQIVAYDSTITAPGAVGMRAFNARLDEFDAKAAPPLTANFPFADNFNTPTNRPDLDRTWTEQIGAFSTQNNNATAVLGTSLATVNTAGTLPNVSVQATVNVTTVGSAAGLVARLFRHGRKFLLPGPPLQQRRRLRGPPVLEATRAQ